MKKIFFLLIFSIFLQGCATFYASRYPNNTYFPTDAKTVQIYYNMPPGEFEFIGEVSGEGAPASNQDNMLLRLKEYAAQIGGDAIIIQSIDHPFTGTITTPGTITGSTRGNAYTNFSGNVNPYSWYYSGQGTTNYNSQSYYTYTPPTVTPLFGKNIKALVIKFKPLTRIIKDDKYGNVDSIYMCYYSIRTDLSKRAKINIENIVQHYNVLDKYIDVMKTKKNQMDKNSYQQELNNKITEVLRILEDTVNKYAEKNGYKAIYSNMMPNCEETDVSEDIISLLNNP